MWKFVIGATAALAVAGSSLAIAQQRYGDPGGPRGSGMERGWRPSPQDRAAFAAARIAALKAGLQLTPDQEKNWPAFESALNDLVKLHADRVAALRQRREQHEQHEQGNGPNDQGPGNPFDRLERRADTLSKYGAALKHLADAGMPLYESLDDSQKHRFTFLSRMLRPHWAEMRLRGWRGRGDRGQGYGRESGGQGGCYDQRRSEWRRDRDSGACDNGARDGGAQDDDAHEL